MGEKGNEGRRESTKEGRTDGRGRGVIRNPDFPDLGILRRSLSKKRREERRGPIRNNWTLAAFSRRRRGERTGGSIGGGAALAVCGRGEEGQGQRVL